MTVAEISQIDKPDRYSAAEAIRHVAGPNWGPLTLAQAVTWAEKPGNSFVVRGRISNVEVKVMPPKTYGGNKYLQTVADKTITNNLLSLPQIPLERYRQA